MKSMTFVEKRRKSGYVLYQCEQTGRYHVVQEHMGQVYSIDQDSPRGGGQWMARNTDEGIAYVSNGRSRSRANALFRKALSSIVAL